MALVFCFCVFNYIYATIMSKIVMDQGNDSTPNLYYAGCAFTYSVAMVASNKALQWVRLHFNYFLNQHMCYKLPYFV